MADEIETQAGEPVYKDRFAKYRAKHREELNAKAAEWGVVNGAAYRAENRVRLRETAAKHREANRDKLRERVRLFQTEHPDSQRASSRKYYITHAEQCKLAHAAYRAKPEVIERARETRRQWAEAHKDQLCAKAAARRARKMQATPAWADLDAIGLIYAECRRLTRETGVVHHVDHIVPLKSKFVCGLHCEANLQIIVSRKNLAKGNRVWPDMWNRIS